MNLAKFFQVTAIFLLLFSVQLVIYAIHELSEGSALPWVNNDWIHVVTEPYGWEGPCGQMLAQAMVVVPAAYLGWRLARPREWEGVGAENSEAALC